MLLEKVGQKQQLNCNSVKYVYGHIKNKERRHLEVLLKNDPKTYHTHLMYENM